MSIAHWLGAGAAAAILATASNAAAQAGAVSFAGKSINVYVGYGPGGGYDAYGRLLGGHIGKHLPGKPSVVVKNMPGAGTVKLTNYLATIAQKDGTEFGIINSNTSLLPLLGDEKSRKAVRYDPRTLTWLGSLNSFVMISMAWSTSGFKTLEDTIKKEFLYGSAGGGISAEMHANLLNQMIGTKWKPLRGYRGSRAIALAMEREEVPGFVGWCWECIKADKPHYLSDNKLNLLLQLGITPHPEMTARGVPHVLDVVKNPKDKQTFRLALSSLAYARPFAAPPGLQPAVKKALRDAFGRDSEGPRLPGLGQKGQTPDPADKRRGNRKADRRSLQRAEGRGRTRPQGGRGIDFRRPSRHTDSQLHSVTPVCDQR